MSEAQHFAEHTLQEAALIFMGIAYIFKVRWILSFKPGKERQASTGRGSLGNKTAIYYSWANIFMPWGMESTRNNLFFYFQFGIFHLGVVSAIGLSFVIPYGSGLLEIPAAVTILQASIGLACLVGVIRIIRRITNVYMRAISTPDDYFSVVLLTVWFFFAFLAVPNNQANGEAVLITYFWMTAFFLVYVPFSKISHYLYYPFTRYYLGKTLGRRGVYPMQRSAKLGPVKN